MGGNRDPKDLQSSVAESFAGERWGALTDTRKVEVCLEMAREAVILAEGARKEIREHYLHLAQQWLNLANEISARNPLGHQVAQARGDGPAESEK